MAIWRRALQGNRSFNNAVSVLGVVGALPSLIAPLLGGILLK